MKYVLAVLIFVCGIIASKIQFGTNPIPGVIRAVSGHPDATAISVTGVLGFIVAVWGVVSQRAIVRRQVTFDFLAKSESNKELLAAHSRFIDLAKKPEGLAQYAAEDKESTDEKKNIKTVMNNFELIAIGIERGIIDFEIYKLWYKTTVVQHWAHAVPFVIALRTRLNNNRLYSEFEAMAGWFSNAKGRPKRGYRMGQWF